jgi:hypothetical protein
MRNQILFSIVVLGGVHCDIYKSFHNISTTFYLNSPTPLFSYIPPSPHSWNSFNGYHFSISIHVHRICTIFTLSHPFTTSSLPLYQLSHCHYYKASLSFPCHYTSLKITIILCSVPKDCMFLIYLDFIWVKSVYVCCFCNFVVNIMLVIFSIHIVLYINR